MNAIIEKQSSSLSRLEKRKILNAMADEGCTAEQIADRLGITPRAVHYTAERMGMTIGRRGGTRRMGFWGQSRTHRIMDELARDAGISRSAMLKRLVEAAAPDLETAKKFLGKAAKATRAYGRRP